MVSNTLFTITRTLLLSLSWNCVLTLAMDVGVKGLPEAHAVPGFATLAGLVLYAAEDPVDIRVVGHRHQITRRYGATAMAQRLWHAMKEYF